MSPLKYMFAAVVLLAAAPSGRADMIPLSDRGMGSDGLGVFPSDCPAEPVQNDSVLFSNLALVGLESFPVASLADPQMAAEDADNPQRIYILMDTQGSLGLCLYALLGLGLCKASPWVKKLSVGVVPGWYHDGGPFQVRHSFAISPDCVHPAPAHCLVPLIDKPSNITAQYRQESIVASWRKSQFMPAVLDCRAPPKPGAKPTVA